MTPASADADPYTRSASSRSFSSGVFARTWCSTAATSRTEPRAALTATAGRVQPWDGPKPSAYVSSPSAGVASQKPTVSNFPSGPSTCSRSPKTPSSTAAVPIGTFTKNSQCQERCSVSSPPSGGPSAGISAVGTISTLASFIRSCGGNARNSSVIPTGVNSPPARPCTALATTSVSRSGARPQTAEAIVNAVSAPRNTRFVPNRSPSHPATGNPTASATRKAVSTVLAADSGRPKSPAIV